MSKLLFGLSLASSILAILFICLAIVTANTSQAVTANLNWFRVHGSNGNVYYSAFTFNEKYGNVDMTFKYSDDVCNVSFCNTCQTNMAATLAFTIMAFIAAIPSFIIGILRYTKESYNTRLMHWMQCVFHFVRSDCYHSCSCWLFASCEELF